MLIGGDDISNDVITLSTCCVNVCLHSRSFPLRANWKGNWKGELEGELETEFKFQRHSCKLSFLFPAPLP